jgi:hypothetical protein
MTTKPIGGIMKHRIVLPDGNGREFDSLSLKVGDVLQKDLHDGFNGWTVYLIETFGDTTYYLVS